MERRLAAILAADVVGYPDIGLENGETLREDWFPVIWPRESGEPS